MQHQPGFVSTDTLLAVTTLSFDIAALELFLPLITGGHLVIASREEALDVRKLKARMSACRPSIMQATPATWRSLLSSSWRGSPDLTIWCGGEVLPPDLAAELLPKCRGLWNVYGPTETTIWSAIHQVRMNDTIGAAAVPIGRLSPTPPSLCLIPTATRFPPAFWASSTSAAMLLARGYLGQPLLTGERFVANPFATGTRLYRTGDLARWRSDGVLECLGRMDNQVKIRGFRIELGEIEAVLNQHPSINQSVVALDADDTGMKQLIAYFEPRNREVPAISDLRAHLKAKLPDYMLPAAFTPIEKFPLTPNGKVDRRALPAVVSMGARGKEPLSLPAIRSNRCSLASGAMSSASSALVSMMTSLSSAAIRFLPSYSCRKFNASPGKTCHWPCCSAPRLQRLRRNTARRRLETFLVLIGSHSAQRSKSASIFGARCRRQRPALPQGRAISGY